MSTTPYIKPLSTQGGTFYTFSSAAEDLAMTFNNTTNKFRFSKYVLLDLPQFREPIYGENTIKFNTIDTAFLDVAEENFQLVNPNNLSPDLEVSLQNYCLNLESTLLTDPNYNPTLKKSVAERVFWKWLKELGAIRFRPANSNEVSSALDQNATGLSGGYPYSNKRWVEEDENTSGNGTPKPKYTRVVQYIGECDIVNSVQNNNNAFSEVYIHVPTEDGNTPLVLFQTEADQNYYPGQIETNSPSDPLSKNYLQGRSYSDGLYGPNGLPTLSIFDQAVLGEPGVSGTDENGNTITAPWYSPRNYSETYYTDTSFFDSGNDKITKYLVNGGSYQTTYTRSRLDGIGLDFNPSNYKPILDDPAITTIEEFNATTDASSFKFNAILLYYDVYDPNNLADSATNLYGVLFLNDVTAISNDGAELPEFDKYMPDQITHLNGNSYGLKINIKFDTDVDNTGVELSVNDYSSFSMSMFMDAANVLQEAASTLNDQTTQIINLASRVSTLEGLVFTTNTAAGITSRVSTLENAMVTNQALFTNTQDILGLIESNTNLINSILNNQTNIAVSYNLDLIKSGNGIYVDRSTPNRLGINNTNQNYDLIDTSSYSFSLNIVSGNTLLLNQFGNYYKHKNFGLTITLINDIIIKIDDTNNQWQRGQTFRLVFSDKVLLNGNNLLIYTDSKGLYPLSSPSGVSFGILVGGFTQASFISSNNKPIFDIVCVDDKNLIFEIDQIR